MKYLVAVLKSLRGVNSQRILAIANSYDWYLPVTHPRRPAWTSRTHCLFINPISFFFSHGYWIMYDRYSWFHIVYSPTSGFFPRSFSWFICRYFITRVTKVFFSNIGVFLSLIQSILVFSFLSITCVPIFPCLTLNNSYGHVYNIMSTIWIAHSMFKRDYNPGIIVFRKRFAPPSHSMAGRLDVF